MQLIQLHTCFHGNKDAADSTAYFTAIFNYAVDSTAQFKLEVKYAVESAA